MTTWARVFFWIACAFLADCSKKPPPRPDYDSPALVVEGSEIFRPIKWGEQFHLYALDVNGDNELDEFRAKM